MKFLLLCTWIWMLLASMGRGSFGCLEEERDALLKINAALNYPNRSSLPSWHGGDRDCCGWTRVECDETTSRVAELDLYVSTTKDLDLLYGTDYWVPSPPLVIDMSLFLPLEELRVLDLSGNHISDLNGTLYPKNLEVLDLSETHLGNDAVKGVARITSLKALVIKSCELNDSKLLEGLCGLRKLEVLDINNNSFWGPLPSCFCDMTSLHVLDVRSNNFSGAIPSSLLQNLKLLEYIALSGNAFEGSLSLASLANNSNLAVFDLIGNRNRLEVSTEEPTWFPSFQLEMFGLSNCVLNKDANGVIPSFLKEQHELFNVQFSHNGMTGNFPNWLLVNNVNLTRFDLTGNNLSGAFHFPSNLSHHKMLWFDVSLNSIEGELPSWIGSIFPDLAYLNLSNNLLKGRIPPSMGNMSSLQILDLSNNGLSGEMPKTLVKDCASLLMLVLSANKLEGQMLPRYANLNSLQFLYLDDNRFTGNISSGLLNSSFLTFLDVSHNFLSGTFPNWIGDLKFLSGLMLSNNFLRGPLPLSLCNLTLERLELSSNNLGPFMPPCGMFTSMKYLHLSNDKLAGKFPEFLSEGFSIVTLDLRYNALSGEIPSWIGSLQNLKALLLQGNHFEGSIPLDVCLLKNMSLLDLSNNNLSGQIPSCLKDLAFGDYKMSSRYHLSITFVVGWRPDGYMVSYDFAYSYSERGIHGNMSVSEEVYSNTSVVGPESHNVSFNFMVSFSFTYMYSEGNLLGNMNVLEEVYFMTKRRSESYKGNILKLMSGLDLSQNNLTGFVPLEIGYLSELLALNLSHNHLMGPIPKTFSKLKNVESLDLSYNSLTGPIPPQLTELYMLSDFSVAHNNLSGRTPDQKYQFGTFNETSYEGNPLLCGPPLTNCDGSNQDPKVAPSFNHTREDDSWREAFLWSFAGSYVVAFLGVVLFLYINSYYWYVLFKFVRKLIPSFPM